ncbi:MAG: YlbF family regulator, partial [Clostridia bacterium]|nr:YlbF family regulator [Clostridia bacterium]
MNVFEKAHELGAMIAESAEFKKVNEAREAQSADNDAALVLMNYNRKRDQLIKEASDPEISNERMQEIRNEME